MVEGFIFMQIASYGGGIGEVLSSWEESGAFTYLFPFLLIFALVFGILGRVQVFKENRAINAIISLVVGLMALQFELVPKFFAEVFPRMGVALSIILVLMILIGLFMDPDKPGIMYTLMGVGAIAAAIVFIKSGGALGLDLGIWFEEHWFNTILAIAMIICFVAIIFSGKSGQGRTPSTYKALGFRTD